LVTSIGTIKDEVALTQMNLEGSHAIAKKGGACGRYQKRNRAKPSNLLPITDANGYGVASTGIVAGHPHDAFNRKDQLRTAFKTMKRWGTLQCR
jgi:hypothetical protein